MLSKLREPNCSRDVVNVLAPRIVAAVGVTKPTILIEALSLLTLKKHPEAIALAMQIETYWLSRKRESDRVPFGGGMYCPMRPATEFNADVLNSLSDYDRQLLRKSLDLVKGVYFLKKQLEHL